MLNIADMWCFSNFYTFIFGTEVFQPKESSDVLLKTRIPFYYWFFSLCHKRLLFFILKSESLSVVSDSMWPHWLYTVCGILQARILEWVAFPFSRGFSQHRDQAQVSHIAGRFFTSWATREALSYWRFNQNLKLFRFNQSLSLFRFYFKLVINI